MDHGEIYDDTWEKKDIERLPYLKNDVSSTASCYARYTKGMGDLTDFGMKNILLLPSLANIYFNNLKNENDEAIST